MALVGNTNAEKIWNFFYGKGLSKAGIAGLMGNLDDESKLRPNNLQNSFEEKLRLKDDTYTAAVDNGSYTNFVYDGAGYGVAQWTFWSRKEALLRYAKTSGTSIADLEMQLNFLAKELEGYPSVISVLRSTDSIREASDAVLLKFERPADQSEAVRARRAGYGQTYYDKYAGGDNPPKGKENGMTEQQLRQNVVDIINGWKGATKGSAKHAEILSIYNNYKPLARGYAVKTYDAYCATTVSAAYIKAGIAEYTGTECGVEEYVKVAKKKGIWIENDAHTPKIGDSCVYDWDDSGVGDNQGNSDHIGIVSKVMAASFIVTEGNMSGGIVGEREVKINGRYIRGFIAPDFASIAAKMGGSSAPAPAEPAQAPAAPSAETVYVVKKGDTLSEIAEMYGTTYQRLAEYNGIANPNLINIGQKIRIPGTSQPAAPQRTYTVAKGDSLWAIAEKYLGAGSRYPEIKSLNGLSSNTIYPGQVLKLPS